MLKVRLISAFTLLPIVLLIFTVGPEWGALLFLMLSSAFCLHEMASMTLPALEARLTGSDDESLAVARRKLPWVVVGIGWLLQAATAYQLEAGIGLVVLGLFGGLLVGEYFAKSIDQAAARAFGILISVCYGALPWLVIWQLYKMGDHAKYVLLVMAITWMGDTGGYFGGRFFGGKLFGGRKLAPTISPKKTWEGAVFGLLMSILGGFILNAVYRDIAGVGPIASPGILLVAGLLGGVFEQLGDLLESLFKRFAGVKDSGSIIPGHGGFLDRVDGILFAAPVIWAVIYYGGALGL
jgi:phosphatidate cytidylyltransferase